MRRLILLLTLLPGCSAGVRSELALVEQSQRGLELVRGAQAERRQMVEQFVTLERRDLDAAFDEDVRQQAALTAEWVIEHRQAYEVGLDALARQQVASTEADRVATANLEAIGQALKSLSGLLNRELKLGTATTQPSQP